MPTFRQEANGTFSVEVDGCFHCGPNHDSPKTFDYTVKMLYHGHKALDEKGFLNDNLAFQTYFDSLTKITDSCEIVAQNAACYFWKQLLGRCKEVSVILWGVKGRAMVEFILDCDPEELELAMKAGA